jgi:hypothetical protein
MGQNRETMRESHESVEYEELPCGCKYGIGPDKGLQAFFIKPCGPVCEVYLYAIAEVERLGMRHEQRIEGRSN